VNTRIDLIIARDGVAVCHNCALISNDSGLFIKAQSGRPFCKECRNAYLRKWRTTARRYQYPEVDRLSSRRTYRKQRSGLIIFPLFTAHASAPRAFPFSILSGLRHDWQS
jgi:hypothetical protein